MKQGPREGLSDNSILHSINENHRPDPESIRSMFGSIAQRYDLLNGILSLGRHRSWRRRAAAAAAPSPGATILDVACGTGDLVRELAGHMGPTGLVTGIDFCAPMIALAVTKPTNSSSAPMRYIVGDALTLPFASDAFECTSIAFGLRNVANPEQAIREMARVTASGGRVLCLEFAVPRRRLTRTVVRLYESTVVPAIGGVLSRRDAYQYLRTSIGAFASPHEVRGMFEMAGLTAINTTEMNLGSVCLHVGLKP